MRIVFPFCNSSNVVKILYGMPNELGIEEYKKGLIHLGGCCVSPVSLPIIYIINLDFIYLNILSDLFRK